MTPYYQDSWLTVYHGDCREAMRAMEPESVHCVVTSPPYWGLRDYGTASWVGGDEGCDHRLDTKHQQQGATSQRQGRANAEDQRNENFRSVCGKCGATRQDSQIGLEPTPEEYVANMVAVFRDVWRVLRKDGTVWLNLGDSYASSPPGNTTTGVSGASTLHGVNGESGRYRATLDAGHATKRNTIVSGLKPKDLVGIPWRVAFALQADGWYLRSDIIWAKPNPMPESVTDRPTKSHEYLFLLSKAPRYYFDADAVREPLNPDSLRESKSPRKGASIGNNHPGVTHAGNVYHHDWNSNPAGRNIRSVWQIATAPYPGAHFATFPPKLVEPCIKAGCPEGGTVLDPFAGSGTTGLVAQSLSRRAVLIDLSLDYLGQLMRRNADIPLGLGA